MFWVECRRPIEYLCASSTAEPQASVGWLSDLMPIDRQIADESWARECTCTFLRTRSVWWRAVCSLTCRAWAIPVFD
jgi:hypothetical protein